MASWMVHLRVAQALSAPFTGTPQEATAYYVGSVGPDCGAYIAENVFDPPTQVTHWAPDGYKRNCDAAAFRAAYLDGKTHAPKARAFLRGLLHPSADRPRMGARHRRACARGVGHRCTDCP